MVHVENSLWFRLLRVKMSITSMEYMEPFVVDRCDAGITVCCIVVCKTVDIIPNAV